MLFSPADKTLPSYNWGIHIKGFSVGEKVAQVTQDSPFGAFMKFEITSKHQMIP
jgi:hypothetical protein